jgi:hypothetical protein
MCFEFLQKECPGELNLVQSILLSVSQEGNNGENGRKITKRATTDKRAERV